MFMARATAPLRQAAPRLLRHGPLTLPIAIVVVGTAIEDTATAFFAAAVDLLARRPALDPVKVARVAVIRLRGCRLDVFLFAANAQVIATLPSGVDWPVLFTFPELAAVQLLLVRKRVNPVVDTIVAIMRSKCRRSRCRSRRGRGRGRRKGVRCRLLALRHLPNAPMDITPPLLNVTPLRWVVHAVRAIELDVVQRLGPPLVYVRVVSRFSRDQCLAELSFLAAANFAMQ